MTNQEYAQGLRLIADFYEQNPVVTPPYRHENYSVNKKEEAKAILRSPGKCEKQYTPDCFKLIKKFGELEAEFVFYRTSICKRKVVSVETIPAKIVPEHVQPASTREVVEWECGSILSDEDVATL